MANIHIYINPSTVNVQASEGTGLTPISAGPLNANGNEISAPIELGIKTDEGYEGTATVDFTSDKWRLSLDNITWLDWGQPLSYDNVTEIMTIFYAQARSVSGEEDMIDTFTTLEITPDIYQITPNTAPIASVSVSGSNTVGGVATATVNVSDVEGDTVASTAIKWLRAGSYIVGETNTAYTRTEADVGQLLQAEATITMSAGPNPSAVLSTGTTIPVPAAPTPTVTGGTGKVTVSFTDSSTLTTDVINGYYTTDGSTPTISSTKITNITSPYDITVTPGTTVKVILERVINGISMISSVASGSPVVTETFTADFTADSDLTDNFYTSLSGSTTIVVNPAESVLEFLDEDSTNDAGIIVFKSPINKSADRTYEVVTKQAGSSTDTSYYMLNMVPQVSQPVVDTSTNWGATGLRIISAPNTGNLSFLYWDKTGQIHYWNGSAWQTTAATASTGMVNPTINYYRYLIETDSENQRLRMLATNAAANTTFAASGWVNYSEFVNDTSTPFWVWSGEPFTDVFANNIYYDKASIS